MNTLSNYIHPCGLLLLALRLLIRYRIGKRRFNRRGIGGVQHFNSYRRAVMTTFAEKLLLLIGDLLGVVGLFLLALAGLGHLKTL